MAKVTLIGATPWPPPHGLMRHSGTVLDVSEDDAERLREMGVVADDAPASSAPAAPEPAVDEDTDDEPAEATGKKYPPLPKKTAGVNAWREYARDNDIDVRGLSEKSELMGHIIKVVTN